MSRSTVNLRSSLPQLSGDFLFVFVIFSWKKRAIFFLLSFFFKGLAGCDTTGDAVTSFLHENVWAKIVFLVEN